MSTATVATVRPLKAIKADAANYLAGKPESVLADIKGAITWLPRKAQAAIMRAARFLHIPQFAAFVSRNFSRFLGVVGKGAFAVEVLTSHWGQATIKKGLEWSAAVVKLAVKWSWRIVTSPLRLFTPTRNAVDKVEAGVAKANAKLTPNSGEAFGPLQITRDIAGYYVSADRTHMRLARTTAVALMTVRITRRFVPVGWMRVLAFIIDGLMIARAYGDVLEHTWVGKKLSLQEKVIEADVIRQAETVGAEATRITREAAASKAAQMRAEADKVEAEGITVAKETEKELVSVAVSQADVLRSEAEALEATAERLSAAETASAVTEALQEAKEGTVAEGATVLRDRPRPGPSGQAPSTGPSVPPHKQHGGGGKPKKR